MDFPTIITTLDKGLLVYGVVDDTTYTLDKSEVTQKYVVGISRKGGRSEVHAYTLGDFKAYFSQLHTAKWTEQSPLDR